MACRGRVLLSVLAVWRDSFWHTHTIRIERFDENEIQSRESNEHIQVWDHRITLKDLGGQTEYTDEVDIRAGWRTFFVWLWAKAFYAHRQRKWIKLLEGKIK